MAKQVRVAKKEEAHREAAKQAAREAILEFQKQEDEGPDDTIFQELDHSNQSFPTQSSSDSYSAPESFDLFDFCDELQSAGTLVQYTIKKNNVLIASSVNHPLSWDAIMKKYGEGLYQVLAKNVATKKFIKSQTQMLGAVVDFEPQKTEEAPAPQNNFGVMEMMTLLERKAQEARREAREEAQRMAELQEKQQNNMITLMTALVANKPQGPSQAEIQLQTMQMMTQMLDKMQSSTNNMIEKLTAKIERVAEGSGQKKEEGPSWADVMKMTVEAQTKGFDMWTKLEELAEKKAEEKIELIEEYRRDSDPVEKETKTESATDSLIKTILPTVVSALAGQNQGQAQMVAAQRQQQQQLLAARQQQEARKIEMQRRQEAAKKQALKKDLEKTLLESVPVPTSSGKVTFGLPKVEIEAEESEAEESMMDADFELVENPVRQVCLEVLPPFLGQLMVETSSGNVTEDQCVTATVNFLMEQGISREEFLTNVKSQDLIDVAEGYNLPDAAKVWLNNLYAGIEKSNTTIGSESSTGLT